MNNAISEIKNTLVGTNNRTIEAEDRISEVEDRMVDINEAERKNNLKKWGQPQRPLGQCQMPQHSNHRSPRRRRQKERSWENAWGDNRWKIPTMGKEIATQVQESQRVPNRINPRLNTPRHILIKLMNIKHKEHILKAARVTQQLTCKGIPIRITADLSIETLQARCEWQ